ncbi:Transposable element Tc1 transposase, partial [Stegodyphus mimosarum]
MPRRRKRARFEQLTEFERGRIIGLREAGLSYRAVASRVQRNSSTVMRVWKQWTDECRTTRKSGSGPRNVTSARDDRHLVRMARTDRTASSRQLAALWSIATGVSLCASSIRRRLLQCGLRARTPLYRIPLTHDHRRLRLQWANQHRDWRADWQHVVFSDESRFNLWYHDGRIRVRRYAGERHLPECIIERHSGRTPGVMVWGAIAYHRRSQLLRIVGNLNSNRYIREVLQPEAVPFLQSLPGAVFQQDNARPHTARIVKSFFAAQQVQLLPWPACSPDMSPIEHVWDVIGRRLARDPRPVASADELWIVVRRPVAGRQRVTASAEDRYIAIVAKRNRRTTSTRVTSMVTASIGKAISAATVRRRLHMSGLYARVSRVCVPLSVQSRGARLQWCRQHVNWNVSDWGDVMLTDESNFALEPDDKRIRI